MALTVPQSNELVYALLAAFPEKARLELMVKRSLEKKLNQITQDDPDYEVTVNNLVEWADEEQGRLLDLVVGASYQNPGNVKLRRFVKHHWQSVLEAEPDVLVPDVLASLVQALQSVDNFVEVVIPACSQTLPELLTLSPGLQETLSNAQLSAVVKWLVLLNRLLQYEKNIVAFVQNLERKVKSSVPKSTLSNWLKQLPAELRPAPSVPVLPESWKSASEEALRQLHGYFAIAVEPPEITAQTDAYSVNGYLISRLNDRTLEPQVKSIPLQAPDAGNSAQASESSQQRQGLSCTLPQIEHSLPDWLLQAEAAIANQCEALQSQYNLPILPSSELTIEFWLPFEHLVASVDTWKIYRKPARLKRCDRAVGKDYRVVVRSYDRFSDPSCSNAFNRNWQQLSAFWQTSPDLEAVRKKVEHVGCWQEFSAIDRKIKGLDPQCQEQFYLGLTLSCPLCSDDYQDQRDELFSTILDAGIPLALWSRCTKLDNLQQTMQELLRADTLRPFDGLLKQVKQMRNQASDDRHLGRHLAIWCDDPDRFRAVKQFQKTGRLGS